MANDVPQKAKAPGIPPAAYPIIALLIAGGAGFWYLQSTSGHSDVLGLTPEAKEYVRNLKLSEVGIKANESYLKQLVVEIDGKINNAGTRTLDMVEVYCVFYDNYGQVVLRDRVPIVKQTTGLKPGETRAFRLPFDTVPDSWNHRSPQIVIAGIRFAA